MSAIEPALRGTSTRWFGHVDRTAPPLPWAADRPHHALPLSARLERDAIDGFCNRTLWPALHGLIGNIEQLEDWWQAYRALSERTAKLLAREAPNRGIVWLQDYHFFGVPAPLKQLRPDLRVGVFCHTPFAADTLATIAPASELARRLGSCDFIGVQTSADAESVGHFLSTEAGAKPIIHVNPVGIDTTRWIELRNDPLVRALAARHRTPEGALAVGVDRLDYTKGIVHKLLAIETLLDSGAIDPMDLRLVQVAVPTRTAVPIYRFLKDQVTEIEQRVNHTHPRSDGIPVLTVIDAQRSPREIAGLYRAADFGLVTPVRDGLNLVAVEFSVINGDRACELILSQGAGAHETLGSHCLSVDGTDVISIASRIREALHPTPELRRSAADRGMAAGELDSASWLRQCLTHVPAQGRSEPPASPDSPDAIRR